MTDRETILRIIEAIGGDPFFWVNAPTCRDALDKAEAILREYVNAESANWQGRYKSIAEQTGFGRPATEPKGFPDGEPYGVILDYLAWCANGWMGDARLVGNLRAGDIVRAVGEVQQDVSRLQAIVNGLADRIAAAHEVIAKRAEKDDRPRLIELIDELWQHAEPSIRDTNIREKVACVLSTAGNARREERPM